VSTFLRLKTKTCNVIGSLNLTDDATALGEWANEAVRDVLLKTGVKVSVGTVSLVAGTSDYTLDDEVLLMKSATLGSTVMTRLGPTELLDRRVRSTSASTGAPWYYALEGTDLFRVHPTPAAAGTITITFVPKPTEMSADGNDPATATYGGIPVEHHLALELYMLWRAADQDDDASSAQGKRYQELYDSEIRKIRKYVNMKGGRSMPRARLGRRFGYVSADNSADW
jgi:hypothetical protein